MNTGLKHGLGSGGGYNISDDDDDGGDRVYGEEEEGGRLDCKILSGQFCRSAAAL